MKFPKFYYSQITNQALYNTPKMTKKLNCFLLRLLNNQVCINNTKIYNDKHLQPFFIEIKDSCIVMD